MSRAQYILVSGSVSSLPTYSTSDLSLSRATATAHTAMDNIVIGVTGATGHLGQLVVEHLLRLGMPPKNVVALVRNLDKAQAVFKGKEIALRPFDYSSKDSQGLQESLKGIDKLLLISSDAIGQRFLHHSNALKAAKEAGIKFIAYTSVLSAESSKMLLAPEHKQTEALIKELAIPHLIFRNGLYIDNLFASLSSSLEHGVIHASGEAKWSPATRADMAEAIARSLASSDVSTRVVPLAGDLLSYSQIASTLTKITGKPVPCIPMEPGEYVEILKSVGVPGGFAEVLVDIDLGIARGDLVDSTGTLRSILGRETTSLEAALRSALSQ